MVQGIGDRRHDQWAADVAPYLLGALPRRRLLLVGAHVATCPACRAEAESLADVPRLLARSASEPRSGALPGRSRDVAALAWSLNRRRRGRRRAITASATFSVAIASVLALVGTRPEVDEPTPMLPLELERAGAARIEASVSVEDVVWGTRVALSYVYGDSPVDPDSLGEQSAYALRVRTSDGRVEEIATWSLVPGRAVVVEAATSRLYTEIVVIEMGPRGGTATHRMTMDELAAEAWGRTEWATDGRPPRQSWSSRPMTS